MSPIGAARAPLFVQRPSSQRMLTGFSGVFVAFFAFGFAAWFSGAASWVGFYAGARGQALIAVAQVTMCVGFAAGAVGAVEWYRRRCRAGRVDVPPGAVTLACFVLPVGNICWAIFVDAIAWHYGQDIVRPAFDIAIMYVVLGGVPVLAAAVPVLMVRMRARCRAS